MKHSAIAILGWYGVAAILAAYIAISTGTLHATSVLYQALNLTGALGILIEARSKKDYQPVVLNIIWVLVAIYGLARIVLP